MMGRLAGRQQAAPQLPAAASSRAKICRPSDRVALKIAYRPQLRCVALYIATDLSHLCLAGRGQHWALGNSHIQTRSATARRIRNGAGKVIGIYRSETNILGASCWTVLIQINTKCTLD